MVRFLAQIVIAGIVAVGAYEAVKQGIHPGGGGAPRRGGGSGSVPVAFETVHTGAASRVHRSVGLVEPLEKINLAPRTTGTVARVMFEPGDTVQGGQVLLELDQREARMSVVQARADLMFAEGNLSQAQVNLDLSRRELQRQQELKTKGLASQQKFDEIDADVKRNDARVRVEDARVAQSRSRLEEEELRLGFQSLEAPDAGIIETRSANVGDAVGPTRAIGVLLKMHVVRVFILVSESVVNDFKPGMTARIFHESDAVKEVQGGIVRVYPAADQQTRLFRVELHVDNPNLGLRPGMYTRVETVVESKPTAVLMARDALVHQGAVAGTFIIDGGKARWTEIELGIQMVDEVEVLAGVNVGDRVVTLGKHLLSNGVEVSVKGDSEAGPDADHGVAKATDSTRPSEGS